MEADQRDSGLTGFSIVVRDRGSRWLDSAAELFRNVSAGSVAGVSRVRSGLGELRKLSYRSFGDGYQTILFVPAILALTESALCWILINPANTPRYPTGLPK